MSVTKLVITTSAILVLAAVIAVRPEAAEKSNITTASVAALEVNLGNPKGLEIDEVRVTDDGVACLDYHVGSAKSAKIRSHAVVQGDEVLKSSSDAERFGDAWTEHCLGPRGGTTSPQ